MKLHTGGLRLYTGGLRLYTDGMKLHTGEKASMADWSMILPTAFESQVRTLRWVDFSLIIIKSGNYT